MKFTQIISATLRWIVFFVFSISAIYYVELFIVKILRRLWSEKDYPDNAEYAYSPYLIFGVPMLAYAAFNLALLISTAICPNKDNESRGYLGISWIISNFLLMYFWKWHVESEGVSFLLLCIILISFFITFIFIVNDGENKSNQENKGK